MSEPVWRVDQKAVRTGGEVAGAYLEQIKKTDLAQLTVAEWDIFCMKLVGGSLMAAIGDLYLGEPPF